jgi:hypothetical protein
LWCCDSEEDDYGVVVYSNGLKAEVERKRWPCEEESGASHCVVVLLVSFWGFWFVRNLDLRKFSLGAADEFLAPPF